MPGTYSITDRNRMALIFTRYLTHLAHLIMVILLLVNRKSIVIAGLASEYTEDEYVASDKNMMTNLSCSIGILLIELFASLSFGHGATIFSSWTTVMSIMDHFISTVLLVFWSIDDWVWDSGMFCEWAFGFGIGLPIGLEIGNIIVILVKQKLKIKE